MTGSVPDFLFSIRRKGVAVWSEAGRLRYRAPKGVLAPDDLVKLRVLKDAIVAFIDQPAVETPGGWTLRPRTPVERIPLTFAQQWLWNGLELARRPSMRMVAAALDVSGLLNIEWLQRCLTALVRRHESLRTRFVIVDGAPTQCVDEARPPEVEILDLSPSAPADREAETKRLIDAVVYEPVLVADGPLFVTRVLRLAQHDHVLIVALDHLISDGASLGILLNELWALYGQAASRVPFSLPPTPVQFGDYAVWQQKDARSAPRARRTAFWSEHLAGARGVRLFGERVAAQASRNRGTMPIRFGPLVTASLRALSQRERTTLSMCVLTAFAASILRWCNETEVVLPFVALGRRLPELESTIGFFGYPIFLRIRAHEHDRLSDLLRRVTDEYSAAYENDDSCEIATCTPSPEFVWNPTFNWFPQEFHTDSQRGTHVGAGASAIEVRPRSLGITLRQEMQWEREVGVRLANLEEGIGGELVYSVAQTALDGVEQFTHCFESWTRRLATEPDSLVKAVTPARA